MDIGWAVAAVRGGNRVTRPRWNGRGMYLEYEEGFDSGGVTYDPYVLMRTAQGTFVPWLASQSDLLANDWELV